MLLINVTGFLRDPEAWQHLSTEVLPQLPAELGPDAPIRVWSAGPLSELRPLVRSALVETEPASEITIAAVNRRGRNSDAEGAILVLEENRVT